MVKALFFYSLIGHVSRNMDSNFLFYLHMLWCMQNITLGTILVIYIVFIVFCFSSFKYILFKSLKCFTKNSLAFYRTV